MDTAGRSAAPGSIAADGVSSNGVSTDADRPFGVVVNPTSALGRGRRVARRVLAAFAKAGVAAVEISGPDAEACREAVRSACATGLRGLVLVGGDGLIGLVLQLPEARALPIGVVPAGSGNDFARQFGLRGHPRSAVHRILSVESTPRSVDLGVVALPAEPPAAPQSAVPSSPDPGQADADVREHWFAGGLSIGFDAAINRRANALRLPLGPLRYHLALLIELAVLRSRPFTVSTETATGRHETRSFYGLLATAMNIRAIGGGIPLAPGASADDGLLDLVEVSHGTKLRILSVLGVLARGRHERLPEVRITRVRRARIEAGDEVAYADGERVGRSPFEVRVAPAALTLLA